MLITFSAVLPLSASAQIIPNPIIPCGYGTQPSCTLCHFGVLANNIVQFLLFGLAAPIATITFIIGGFLMITAGGNQNQLERGKSIFQNTVIGIVLAFGAFLIVNLVIQGITTGEYQNLLNWTEGACKKK